jgi:beta-N-acetylhexosaminidase
LTTSLRKKAGQLLIAGVEGVELSAMERSWLKIIEPGGVILFRRNIESAAATFDLLAEIGALSSRPLFRCVDVEGGLVDRLRDAVAPMPSLAAVAASGKKALYRSHGALIGREACALGFNTVFAPVLDLALPESREVMRTRTCFDEPRPLIAYAGAFLEGLAGAGVLGCGKHFPGLGGGALDSHHATPAIERSWETLWTQDMLPYRELKAQLPMVMVSHAVYPLTGDTAPASVSRDWIGEVLIRKIGYRGLIVSDDMEMGGIATQRSIEETVVQAVLAGTHLVEICKDPSLVLRAYEVLLAEAEKSAAFREVVEKAYRKISRSKRSLRLAPSHKPPSPLQIEKLRRDVAAFSERVSKSGVEAAP